MDFQLNLETETVLNCHPAKPCCAAPTDSIRSVFKHLQEDKRGAAMICENNRLVGIFTERDALKLMAEGADWDAPISTVMITNVITLRPNDTVGHAIALMSKGGFRRLPIVDDQGRIVGVLKVDGILNYLVEQFPKVVYNLPPEPHHKTATREGA